MNPTEYSSFLMEERESNFCGGGFNHTVKSKDNHDVCYRNSCDLSADTSPVDPVDIHFMLLDACYFIMQGEL